MATVDIRVDDKLVFSQRADSHKISVADDGKSATLTVLLAEQIVAPEVETQDIDAIHARLQSESANAEADSAKVEPAPGTDLGTADGGTYTQDPSASKPKK